MEITSQLPPSKIEEVVKKVANKIPDAKLHTEDVLQELKSKIISLQLVESDTKNFIKLCKILQNSIKHNNIEVLYRNYLKKCGLAKPNIFSEC